ncbi:bacteriocin maturation protein [Cohnella yongneupensis]|uniref:Bacteriocin maturation protein n=1 Tax=Cohnella yongneupensis TaxID=425006 RepID=A0ABW0QXD3_9BACL
MTQLPNEIVGRYDSPVSVKVLAVGAGSLLVSLVEALFESGLSEVHVIVTDSEPTDRHLLIALAEKARKSDPKAELKEWTIYQRTLSAWRERVQPFDWILYVSQQMKVEEIQAIHSACRAEMKSLLIATCIGQTGFAGPYVNPNSEGCWESARRRIHQSGIRNDPMPSIISFAARLMLVNIIVFDMYRTITRMSESELNNRLFVLDLQTLEGGYHSFLPHPLITSGIAAEQIQNWDQLLVEDSSIHADPQEFLSFISQLTSPQSGILHLWDEGDLNQLPLSQCRVQAVDPLSEGPAGLLPVIICSGLTHLEARKEAGLAGIEAYVQRMSHENTGLSEQVEVGAGETVKEAVYRGLQKCLTHELRKRAVDRKFIAHETRITHIEDLRCRHYLQVLTTMQGAPTIGLGDDLLGFQVVWIGTGDRWHGCVGLNRTLALRMALQQAIHKAQNPTELVMLQGVEVPTLDLEEAIVANLEIKAVEDTVQVESIQYALPVLQRNQMRLSVYQMRAEPFLNEHLGGLLCVMLGREEASG